MTREELRQSMMVCIVTLQMMNGRQPEAEELYRALGTEYAAVLAEYLMNCQYSVLCSAA